jgi:hypothetical protein
LQMGQKLGQVSPMCDLSIISSFFPMILYCFAVLPI